MVGNKLLGSHGGIMRIDLLSFRCPLFFSAYLHSLQGYIRGNVCIREI